MADIKWVKLSTDMFTNRKIRHLRRLPGGNDTVLIWIMLLTMAGRCNDGGKIFFMENIPYTVEMLAADLGFTESEIGTAIDRLASLNMIKVDGGILIVVAWEEYQNVDGMERVREKTKERVARFRDKKSNVTGNVTVTVGNAIEEERRKKKEDIDIDYKSIVDLYNSICISLPSVRSLSEARKTAIRARLNTYSVDDFAMLFTKAQSSSFLTGGNEKNWMANFDWLLKDANMAKVLDGNYDKSSQPAKNGKLNQFYDRAARWAND